MSIVYLAPLEGVTDAVFRQTHHACFGGVSKYFIPFVSPTQNLVFTSRDLSSVAPEHNIGVPAVPRASRQGRRALQLGGMRAGGAGLFGSQPQPRLPLRNGYREGQRLRSAGGLSALERFLDGIFGNAPLPISIKTRIGYTSADEFERLLALFSRYPVHELIIHPRTRAEFYKGTPHRDVFTRAFSETTLPLCFNGNLFSAEDCRLLTAQCPQTHALMIGRGLIANPALAQELNGGDALTPAALRDFHNRLFAAYCEKYPPHVALGRMREIAKHMVCCFEQPEKPRKAIRKASSLRAYSDAIDDLFSTHAFCAHPAFQPD